MEQCTERHRIDRLEADVRELRETDKKLSDDIVELKEGQAEEKNLELYQKIVAETQERIDQYRQILAEYYSKPTDTNS